MRLLCTLFIILITAASSFFVWMHFSEDYKHWFASEDTSLKGKNLFRFDINSVRSVEITNSEGVSAEFKFKNNRWVSTKPWDDRADNIAPLLTFAHGTIVYEEVPTDEAPAEDFGFGSSSEQVTIRDDEGNALASFELGVSSAWKVRQQDQEQLIPTVYLRDKTVGDDAPTYLCTDPQLRIHTLFKNKLIGLRDYHPIYQADVLKLTRVVVKQNGSAIELIREIPPAFARNKQHPKTLWKVKKPLELRADQKRVNQVLQTLMFLTAQDLKKTDEVSIPSSDEKLIEVELSFFKSDKDVTLKIYPSTTENNITLATISDRPNVVFELPERPIKSNPVTYTSLPKNVNDIRSRSMLSLNLAWIDTVSIQEKGTAPVRLTKFDHWNLITNENKKIRANEYALTSFIESLTQDNILAFVSDAATDLTSYGLDKPKITVYMLDKLNNPQIIKIGKPVEFKTQQGVQYGYYAKSEGSDTVWLIDSKVVPGLQPKPWQWLPLSILESGISSVRTLRIQKRNKPTQFIDYNYDAGTLTVREGNSPKKKENPIITELIDANRARYLIKGITNLKASKRINPHSRLAHKALAKPLMTIDLSTEDIITEQTTHHQFVIAAAGKASTSLFFYIKNSKTGEIFEIDRATCINLYSPIRYKSGSGK